ncbi:MAG: hypothetical protein FD123_3442 [Bacteroidetes bacterium]|nr:MAG: hypothetical protein FD123_3442 [Bacteroidota bacterium]
MKQPEEYYNVTITDEYLKVEHPDRKPEQINWRDIEEILIVTTDEGPFLPDVWLVLTGNGTGCSLPQGAPNYDLVYDIVSKYEGFDFEAVIKSALSTDNARFDVWKRKP